MFGEKLFCLLDLHNKVIKHKGVCYYQKGERERFYFEGTLYGCKRKNCNVEIFEQNKRKKK